MMQRHSAAQIPSRAMTAPKNEIKQPEFRLKLAINEQSTCLP
jgi:hypothetical protein